MPAAPEPPFCTRELAVRIERAETELLAGGVAAGSRRGSELEPLCRRIAGGLATWGGPGSPLNKVAGLGFAGPVPETELAGIEREMSRRGAGVRIELSTLAEAGTAERLTRRGYALVGFENVLGLALPVPRPGTVPSGIEVAPAREEESALWLETVVEGFAAPDVEGAPAHEEFTREALERVIGDLAASDGFRRYLARRGGVAAGGASLRVSEQRIAQLCGASTLPEHRRRGVQTALLSRRLADAAGAGCDFAVVTTEPGSKSQQNVQRQGFHLLYARAILVREPAT